MYSFFHDDQNKQNKSKYSCNKTFDLDFLLSFLTSEASFSVAANLKSRKYKAVQYSFCKLSFFCHFLKLPKSLKHDKDWQ